MGAAADSDAERSRSPRPPSGELACAESGEEEEEGIAGRDALAAAGEPWRPGDPVESKWLPKATGVG